MRIKIFLKVDNGLTSKNGIWTGQFNLKKFIGVKFKADSLLVYLFSGYEPRHYIPCFSYRKILKIHKTDKVLTETSSKTNQWIIYLVKISLLSPLFLWNPIPRALASYKIGKKKNISANWNEISSTCLKFDPRSYRMKHHW